MAELDIEAIRRMWPRLRPKFVMQETGLGYQRLRNIFLRGMEPKVGEARALADMCERLVHDYRNDEYDPTA